MKEALSSHCATDCDIDYRDTTLECRVIVIQSGAVELEIYRT